MSSRHVSRACALVLLASACTTTPQPGVPAEESAPPAAEGATADAALPATEEPDAEAAARRQAAEAALAGEYERAREILGELLIARYLERSHALLAEGQPEDALLWVDRALDLDPDSRPAQLLRGEEAFLLAEHAIERGESAVFVLGAFEDSLASYRAAGDSPRALFGASRAALQLDRPEEALDFARNGMAARRAGREPGIADAQAYRAWSEASFRSYSRARAAGAEEASALFDEAETALNDLLGRTPADPWVWSTLASLNTQAGRQVEALAALERGLDRAPEDGTLLASLIAVARTSGEDAVIETLERVLERHPELSAAWYQLGWQRFERALTAHADGADSSAELARAETEFVRARETGGERAPETRSYEVMCRDGIGWCRYAIGDLEGAEAAFRSMEQVFAGGLAWRYEGRLRSGIEGLHFVGAAWAARAEAYEGSPLEKPEHLGHAASIYSYLAAYEPEQSTWANNAGFFHRDAGVDLELLGRTLCRAARGEITGAETLAALRRRVQVTAAPQSAEERAAFRAAAGPFIARGREHMEQSYSAYLEAARLAPDDVGIVNDTALIAIYHLYRDLDRAEEMLLHAVEVGALALQSDALDEDARWSLQNTWGDAHQNLGILYYHHRHDPEVARTWFEKSVAIGPEPRPLVSEVYLKLIDEEPGFTAPPYVTEFLAWGSPCAE